VLDDANVGKVLAAVAPNMAFVRRCSAALVSYTDITTGGGLIHR